MSKPVTFVTALFDLQLREKTTRRSAAEYLRLGAKILETDVNLVIWIESHLFQKAYDIRSKVDPKMMKTTFVVRSLESLKWYSKYISRQTEAVSANKIYFDVRDTPSYMSFSWSKMNIIEETIGLDPFKTDHFAWIDLGLLYICKLDDQERWNPNNKLSPFYVVEDKMRFCRLKPISICDVQTDKLDTFFRQQPGLISAAYITGNKFYWGKWLSEFEKYANVALDMNLCPLEECIMAVTTMKNPHICNPYWGTYYSILANVHYISMHEEHLLTHAQNSKEFQLCHQGYDIVNSIQESIDAGVLQLSAQNKYMHDQAMYIMCWYTNNHIKVRQVTQKIIMWHLYDENSKAFWHLADHVANDFKYITKVKELDDSEKQDLKNKAIRKEDVPEPLAKLIEIGVEKELIAYAS